MEKMAESDIKNLPNFESIDEMVEFFDNEDLGDYLGQMPEVEFEVDINPNLPTPPAESRWPL